MPEFCANSISDNGSLSVVWDKGAQLCFFDFPERTRRAIVDAVDLLAILSEWLALCSPSLRWGSEEVAVEPASLSRVTTRN